MANMKLLISDKIAKEGLEELKKFQGIEAVIKTGLKEEELISEIPVYDALVVRSATRVTERVIEAAGKLKVIGRAGAGVDNIDVDAATKHDIVVMNTPGGNSEAAAELAIALMFAAARNVAHADSSMKSGRWDKKLFTGVELLNKTLGIIGTGFVGGIVSRRAGALGMNVIAYDPYISKERALEIGAELTGFDDLLNRADFISIHVPKNRETSGLINKAVFNKMKDSVFFVNCSRGGIVSEDDLLEALESGKVAAAGIDVYESEPPVSLKLVRHPKVTATPHIGASTREAQVNVAVMVMDQIGTYLTRGEIINSVNKPEK